MGLKCPDEFRADPLRIALTSRLSRKQVASDLGAGLSTLNTSVTAHCDTEAVSDKDLDLACENERLRRENRFLNGERETLNRGSIAEECGTLRQTDSCRSNIARRIKRKSPF